jgi:hypothetical protein
VGLLIHEEWLCCMIRGSAHEELPECGFNFIQNVGGFHRRLCSRLLPEKLSTDIKDQTGDIKILVADFCLKNEVQTSRSFQNGRTIDDFKELID